MNVNDMYRICQFAVNKAQNGYLTPSEFNLTINQAQVSYQDYLLGEFQQYQYGRPQARINYSQNQNIRQRLTPLLVETTLNINSTTGQSPYPADYVQTDTVITSSFNRVRYVQQDALYSFYNSQIDPIATNPIYLLEPTGFQFYPVTLGSAILTYVKDAPEIVWAYTTVNGRPVYSSGTSVQPVWDNVDLLEIIARALKLIGLNLQDGQVQQYANQVTQTGQ
jgi:S-methylmethionine-dependent homocysteine/selenocysteine methylase